MILSSRTSISGATSLYGVIGDPIAHSLSPLIHNFWMAEANIDAVYGAYHVVAANPVDVLRAVGGFGVQGLNVTTPHKQAAFNAAEEYGSAAQAIGVANTLTRREDGRWSADNTDAEGFLWGLGSATEGSIADMSIVVIGAGGASRAVVHALHQAGARLTILNRTPEKADALAAELAPGANTGALDALSAALSDADAAVNATSLGYDKNGAMPSLGEGGGRLFFDLSYGAAAKATLAAAENAGWRPLDGLSMLVGQAAASFRIWFGVEPDRAAALELCRKAEAARQ